MKRINIALTIDRPFELRDFKRYGVEHLSKFFNVFVLDCSYLINKDIFMYETNQRKKKIFNYDEKVYFFKYKELSKFLDDNSISFYIDLMGVSFSCMRVRKMFKMKG